MSDPGRPDGFACSIRKSGEVVVRHHGKQAALLKGRAAAAFVAKLSAASEDQAQHLMARVTGNYKRGNERVQRDGQVGDGV